jgi:glycosyltransferase involved in cell wall biosynthesis
MDDAPRVSVLLPVYNAEQFVEQAVNSILGQTFKNFELIVIDDGSTDRSAAILESLARVDSRIAFYRQPNAGLIASLNRACSLGRGTYVARMDADDISLPTRFEKQVAYLDSHKDIGVAGTWIQDIDARGQPGPVWPLPSNPATIVWFLMFGNCMAHPSIMMRSEIMKSLGYRTEAAHIEDYDLWVRAAAATRLANIPEVLLRHRVFNQSVSTRHLSSQQEAAAKLQYNLREEILGTNEPVQTLSADLLLKLFFAHRKKYSLDPGDESEIVLDIFRRLYLSGGLRQSWARLVPLLPNLISVRAFSKLLRFARFYASNVQYGFTTQRRVPE